jgi:hypothetical protein
VSILETWREGVLSQAAFAALISQLVLELSHAIVRRTGSRPAKDERSHFLGRQPRQSGNCPPSHGLRDRVRALDPEVIEECDEIGAEHEAPDRHVTS